MKNIIRSSIISATLFLCSNAYAFGGNEANCINKYVPKTKNSYTSRLVKNSCEHYYNKSVPKAVSMIETIESFYLQNCDKLGLSAVQRNFCARVSHVNSIIEYPHEHYDVRTEILVYTLLNSFDGDLENAILLSYDSKLYKAVNNLEPEKWELFMSNFEQQINENNFINAVLNREQKRSIAKCILKNKPIIKSDTSQEARILMANSKCIAKLK